MSADDLITTFRTAQAASTGIESTDSAGAAASGPGDHRVGRSPGLVD
jgi:hypothetical protein